MSRDPGPWDNAQVSMPLSLMQRLQAIEEHAGMLRDAVESIAAGSAQKAETIRAQCRLLVRAYDEGTQA